MSYWRLCNSMKVWVGVGNNKNKFDSSGNIIPSLSDRTHNRELLYDVSSGIPMRNLRQDH